MTFLHWSLLIGGCVLPVIPVVLHMLMRGKVRRYEFPALRFVQSRSRSNQRRFQLRHILLLLLRVLLVALLGMALARPSMKLPGASGSKEAPVAAAFVFDTSPGMDLMRENRTSLDRAAEMADWLLMQLPKESQVAIVDGQRRPASFQVDLKAASQRIERLKTTADARAVVQSIDRALELLRQSDLPQREVYVFTDMSASGWKSGGGRTRQLIDQIGNVGVYVIDVGTDLPINTGIEQLRLSGDVVAGRAPVLLNAEVVNEGPATERIVELYLSEESSPAPADGSTPGRKRGQQTVRFDKENQRQEISFELAGLSEGLHQGQLRLIGQDALEADDQRWFTIDVRPAWDILLVAQQPIDEHALYVKNALSPESLRRTGSAEFECDTIGYEQLAEYTSGDQLVQYAAVLLLDPGVIDDETLRNLSQWTAAGNGLGVFLGREASQIESMNSDAAQSVLAAPLIRQARAPEGDLFLAPSDYQNPILATFRQYDMSFPWSASPIYRYWQVGKMNRGATVAVPLSNGRPAVMLRPLGQGRTLTMTTPISDPSTDRPWNLLPISEASWTFLMLADGMAKYLVGAGEQNYNFLVGQIVTLHTEPGRAMRSYVLRKPGQADDVRLTPDLDTLTLSISSTDQPGNYQVQAGGEANLVSYGFSVNIAPSQLDLSRTNPEELKSMFGETPYQLARDRTEIERGVAQGRVGRELFPLLALILAIILAGEMILSNRFYR